jgi:hypothetical protein
MSCLPTIVMVEVDGQTGSEEERGRREDAGGKMQGG